MAGLVGGVGLDAGSVGRHAEPCQAFSGRSRMSIRRTWPGPGGARARPRQAGGG